MSDNHTDLVDALLQQIDLGMLNPGDSINEAALMAHFGISRTPLREALLRLEALGLVLRTPRKGATIFRPTMEQFLAILEVHAGLEGQAAELAARRLSPQAEEDIEAAVRACETHAATHGDAHPDGYYQCNLRFHEAVALASGNPFLLDVLKTNARKLLAYYRARYAYPGAIAASADDHRRIATLIFARDAEAAKPAMQSHVQFDQITAMDLLARVSGTAQNSA